MDLDYCSEVRVGRFETWFLEVNACIVDQNRQRSHLTRYLTEQIWESSQITDIGGKSYHGGTKLANCTVQQFLSTSRDNNTGSGFAKAACDGQSKSSAASSDHGDLSIE